MSLKTYLLLQESTASSRTEITKLVSDVDSGETDATRVAWSTAPTDVFTNVPQDLLGAVVLQTKGSDLIKRSLSSSATWTAAQTKCQNNGNQRLCDWSEICPRGTLDMPHQGMRSKDSWVPVGCGTGCTNQWVNIGNDKYV